MEVNKEISIKGKVVAKQCKCCSHHEIGIETEDGKYIQLKHGMKIVGHLDLSDIRKPLPKIPLTGDEDFPTIEETIMKARLEADLET